MSFVADCHKLLRKIPKGRVTTYKIIAEKLGKKSYRAVGVAVVYNRDIPRTPCHRILNYNVAIGGYYFGVEKKITLLANENVEVVDGKIINFEQIIYKF
ncbi:MAG: methylated-DNA-[protein]-cysteine S-methyltransferase [Rickettsiales bacterium]